VFKTEALSPRWKTYYACNFKDAWVSDHRSQLALRTRRGRKLQRSLTERESLMPTELVWVGGVLVAVGGALVFALIRRVKPVEPPHFL
jgi:hypothetical protein